MWVGEVPLIVCMWHVLLTVFFDADVGVCVRVCIHARTYLVIVVAGESRISLQTGTHTCTETRVSVRKFRLSVHTYIVAECSMLIENECLDVV